ncbi:glycosyltransferase family 4 protein [Halomonas alkalicola]|uniref:glycosyltransferase family 4 protein n=1 Tax=Halomonas alkalicola TaxID=1930622 RepID=UPI00265FB34F|nr:glycosyltransferase family 4 protein [Halomonas alkalicola]
MNEVLLIGPLPKRFGGKKDGGVAQHVATLLSVYKTKGINYRYLSNEATGWSKKSSEDFNQVKLGAPNIVTAIKCFLFVMNSFPSDLWRPFIFLRAMKAVYIVSCLDLSSFSGVVIHAHSTLNFMGPLIKKFSSATKLITTVHSYHAILESKDRQRQAIVKLVKMHIDTSDVVVHVSPFDHCSGEELGVILDKSFVVPNYVPKSNRLSCVVKNYDVIFVGSLIPRKRISLMIHALAGISQKLRVLIIGAGDEKDKIENFVSVSHHDIRHLESASNDLVRNYMAQSRVLVVPSESESFGLVYLEALQEGAKVIGYCKSIDYFVDSFRQTGMLKGFLLEKYLFGVNESETSSALRIKIEDALSGPDISDANRINLQKSIDQVFGFDIFVKKLVELYE